MSGRVGISSVLKGICVVLGSWRRGMYWSMELLIL